MYLSTYIIAVICAWITAQGLKYIISGIKSKNFMGNFRQLYLSGSMPSAHSASVVALMTTIGLRNGIDSAIFAMSLLFGAVVMYDAVMVRRSSGEQGEALTKLIKENKSNIRLPRVARGHTPVEVLAGGVVGFLVGLLVDFFVF